MRKDAIQVEELRVGGINDVSDYTSVHERHRIFPSVFENRRHEIILDVAAGVGVLGKRLKDHYSTNVLCNDISPTCLKTIKKAGLKAISFDIDDNERFFPFSGGTFSAVIALSTIEHLIYVDHFLKEIHRILNEKGVLYISAPNYSGLLYLFPFLISGKTFHDPLSENSRYEFYAHVRYFTYNTLFEFVSSFGFTPDTVYLALPEGSSRYQALKAKSKFKAVLFRSIMKILYMSLSPRWASEPLICFRKTGSPNRSCRKVIL